MQPVSGWPRSDTNAIGEVQRVHYKGHGKQARVLLHDWKHLVALLLQNGMVKAIRARPVVLEMLNKVLSVGVFWCALTPDEPDSIWDELVLVMPDEIRVPRAGLSDNNKIFFIPDHLPDPLCSHRNWADIDQHAVSLEDFRKILSYVNN